MKGHMSRFSRMAAIALALVVSVPLLAAAQPVRERYNALVAREQTVMALISATRPDAPAATRDDVIRQARSLIAGYDALVRRFHSSGYSDNALWNAATIADALYTQFSRDSDKELGARYLRRLAAEYPTSSLLKQAKPAVARAETAAAPSVAKIAPVTAPPAPPAPSVPPAPPGPSALPAPSNPARATLTAIDRSVSPEGVRITLSLDREVPYTEQRLSGPSRVFFDLREVQTTPELRDAVLRYTTDAVRQIRVGRHPNDTVRVVLDLEGVAKYSVFTLYSPFRLVVDAVAATTAASAPTALAPVPAPPSPPPPVPAAPAVLEASATTPAAVPTFPVPPSLASPTVASSGAASAETVRNTAPTPASPRPVSDASGVGGPKPVAESAGGGAPKPAVIAAGAGGVAPPPPVAPIAPAATATAAPVALAAPEHRLAPGASASAPTPVPGATADRPVAPVAPGPNTAGGFSLSRQLGLGVTRVVIDPGHGGHDPGAQAKGLSEAELTLDVALRLEALLQSDGLEVVLTRRTNVYIPLEERTAIANREGADLFLSIHANASRNATARGVETYFLSFASSPDAEVVASRENSASSSGMHNLPDIIKAIALNNKLDESRDFAGMVQEAMVTRLRRSNKTLRNIGVKKAPFVVLIGAQMPSVLAEMSFLTNKQELQLLKTNAYKQRIAEALQAAVLRYRRSLKGQVQVADK